MPSSTSIPIIVQGNSFTLAIPLQIYVISEGSMVLQDYTPDPTDQVSIQLKGSRRQYTYAPTIQGNTAFIDLSGNEMADNYGVVVSIVKADGTRLRSFRTDQFFIVESSDDLTPDDIIEGLENNVIYLNSQAFIAGADGRGITSIVKTSTVGLVDTYTITYSDNTTSTFAVTNGANGQAGAQGQDGVGITSIEKTATVGLVDTYTITLSNGQTSTFDVTNGKDGVDLGLATIVDNLTEGGSTNVLSAEQGKVLGNDVYGQHGVVSPNMAITSQSGNYPTTKVVANNFTTTDYVEGINVVLRGSTTLTVLIYNISTKIEIETLATGTYAAGSHSITFANLVSLGTNEYIAVKTSQLNWSTSNCIGCYLDGALDANKEASYELRTLKKGLQDKVADLEDATTNLPTIEADVLGTSGKYVSPITPIANMPNQFNLATSYANRIFTDKKVIGVRILCYKAGEVNIGVYNREEATLTNIKQVSTVIGFNRIIFDTAFYLKPSELVAVGATSSANYCLKTINSGDVGYYNATSGAFTSSRAVSFELIVEDDGLVGDVGDLEKIPTNKSWCSVGTSITHINNILPSALPNVSKQLLRGYQDRVRDKIDFTNFYNVGVSGQAIAAGGKSGNVQCLAAQVDTVLTTVADYYTIEHGINDWNRCNAIGTIDDFINNTGYTTFFGAWRIVIDKIYTLNPSAQIILITPRKAYGAGVFPSHWYDANTYNGVDYYLKDYVEAVRAIGEFLSLPVCDWFGESNTNQYNLAADSVDVALHPDDTGYQKLANLLVQTFKKVID